MDIKTIYGLYNQKGTVSTDTRKILPGSIFFALKGENFNGNAFAKEALDKGAAYAVIDEAPKIKDDRFILVPDVLACLQALALEHRRNLSAPVVAIGGSNGKTTTKELVNLVLSLKYRVCATTGNLNNHIGVPLTLLSAGPETEMVVVEMGTNHPGEMKVLLDIAEPGYGVVTNIGKEHLEGFGSLENVAREESEMYYHLIKNEGLAFVNADDEWLMNMAGRLPRKLSYGFRNATADIKGTLHEASPAIKYSFTYEGQSYSGTSQLMGGYNLQNILAAVSIGLHFGVDTKAMLEAVASYTPSNNRSQMVVKGSNTIWLDAYNANPSSMDAAIRSFVAAPGGPKVMMLGDMLELGEHAAAEHEAIVKLTAALPVDQVVLVGPEFEKAGSSHALHFADIKSACDHFLSNPVKGSLILVKGSRGIQMEKILEVL